MFIALILRYSLQVIGSLFRVALCTTIRPWEISSCQCTPMHLSVNIIQPIDIASAFWARPPSPRKRDHEIPTVRSWRSYSSNSRYGVGIKYMSYVPKTYCHRKEDIYISRIYFSSLVYIIRKKTPNKAWQRYRVKDSRDTYGRCSMNGRNYNTSIVYGK